MESGVNTKIGSIILKNVVCRNIHVQRDSRSQTPRYRAFFSFDAASGITGRLLSSVNEIFPDLSLTIFQDCDQAAHSELTVSAMSRVLVPPDTLPLYEVEADNTPRIYYPLRDAVVCEGVFSASVNVLIGGVTVLKFGGKYELAHTVRFSYIRVLHNSKHEPWVCTGTYTTQPPDIMMHKLNMCRLNSIKAEIQSSREDESIVIQSG